MCVCVCVRACVRACVCVLKNEKQHITYQHIVVDKYSVSAAMTAVKRLSVLHYIANYNSFPVGLLSPYLLHINRFITRFD